MFKKIDLKAADKWKSLVEVCITQLEHMQPDPVKRTEHCQADINGYRELLRGDEETIERFMKLKQATRQGGKILWNTEVIELLRQAGEFSPRVKLKEYPNEDY